VKCKLVIGAAALALALATGCGRGSSPTEVEPFGAKHLADPASWAGCGERQDRGACGVEQCERYLAQDSFSDEDGGYMAAACERGFGVVSSALDCAKFACSRLSAHFPKRALELMRSADLVEESWVLRAALASPWLETEDRLVMLLEAALSEDPEVADTMMLAATEMVASTIKDWKSDPLPRSWPRASALARDLVGKLPRKAGSHVFGLKTAAVLDWESTVPLLIESVTSPKATAVSASTAAEALDAIHRFGVPEHSREVMLTVCRTHPRHDLASVCLMMLDEAAD
jgi:hypothetical protein